MRSPAPLLLLAIPCVFAADLKPETLATWNSYVNAAQTRMHQRLAPGRHFLWIDETPGAAEKVRDGEIIVAPAARPQPHRVASGLIHDWIGAAFIPDANGPEVLAVLRDYAHYKDFYKPYVIDSKPLSTSPTEDRFSVIVRNKAVILRTAIDGDYKTTTVRVDRHRWYSVTQSTALRDIEDFGTPEQHLVPEGRDGLVWRLFSISRYEERDGGVYVEIEAMALSRDIPFTLRWLIDPIVRRISRSSLSTSLKQTAEAVHDRAEVAHRGAAR